jgi:pimeloyl-ACP methyl ester carboxylesterase
MHISIGEVSLHVVDRGSGRPVLLVHGFPLDHSMWVGQIQPLSKSFRVIAPDLRGFGKSSRAGDVATMSQFADDLAAVLDKLSVSEPVVVCGLSMGGYVAMQFWKRHRERLSGLVLCDTRAAADSPDAVANRHALAESVLKEGSQVAANAMLPKLFPSEVIQAEPPYFQSTRQVILTTSPQTIAAALRGMAERPDMRAELPHMATPTLVVCGEADAISPVDEMRSIAAAIPGSTFEVIEGAGHMAPLQAPERFNRILQQWLA